MKTNRFFNRELSWIEFNYRVLEEALDKKNPLLERLKFLAIFSNNLDEFVMIRIAGLISQATSEYQIKNPSGLTSDKLLIKLQNRINELVEIQYKCFREDIIKGLKKDGFHLYNANDLPKEYIPSLKDLFLKKFFLILTPMAIDQSRPFPFLSGKSLNILINLKNTDKDNDLFAVIPVPSTNRFIKIPDDNSNKNYIYIEEFIKLFVDTIFKGYDVIQTCTFRITRDAELSIDEEDAVDLLSAIEDNLRKRAKGSPIRLEIESSANKKLVDYLSQKIKFYDGFCFSINGPLNLASFFDIVSIKGFDHLRQEVLHPVMPIEFTDQKKSIFEIITEKDRLIHLPYESFDPVIRFIEEASLDKKVMAIKLTLYRTSGDSPIIHAIKKAAENGKQVTVLVELKARFDEAQNIIWAKQLEKVGCHVVYGLVGLKTHCKMALVVRDEEEGIKRYIHLSTGNYNENTAKLYTDIGLFTAKKSFGRDVTSIFNLLTGFSEPPRWKKLVCAPLDLRNFFIEKIEIEKNNVKNGRKGKIIAKMNALIDTKIIEALYSASKVGVHIQLIIRGMCRLRPGVKELSENISVISIVDRFLEHSRIYYFYNSGEEKIYLSSADWMERNLDRRMETLFPIEDQKLIEEIITCLKIMLKDNKKARILMQEGMYVMKKLKNNEQTIYSQEEIYNYIVKNNALSDLNKDKRPVFIPLQKPNGS